MHTLALFYGLPEVENGGNSQKVSGIFWVHTKKMSTFLLSFPLSLFLLSELQYRVVKSHFLWEKISLYDPEFFVCLIELHLDSVFMKSFKRIWTISHRRQATDIFWIKENFWVLHCYTLNFLKKSYNLRQFWSKPVWWHSIIWKCWNTIRHLKILCLVMSCCWIFKSKCLFIFTDFDFWGILHKQIFSSTCSIYISAVKVLTFYNDIQVIWNVFVYNTFSSCQIPICRCILEIRFRDQRFHQLLPSFYLLYAPQY